MRKRTLSRDLALKILYQSDIKGEPIFEIAEEFLGRQESIEKEVYEFSKYLVCGVAQNLKSLDEKIQQFTTNWQLDRMAIIDRNILRIGVFELLFAADVPPKVTINEAVELAKKYGDLDSSKFVNGVLDKIHKTEFISQNKAL